VILGVLTLVGVLLAWLLGANLGGLRLIRLRASWLVFVALAIQVVLFSPASGALHLPVSESTAHVATYAALLAFVVANIRRPGLPLAALGCGLNTLVIAANGGRMPVSLASWTATGKPASELVQRGSYNNVVLASHAHVGWLGDVFALPRAVPLANSLSIGDLLLLAGVITFVFRAGLPARYNDVGRTREVLSVGPFRRLLAGRTMSKLGDWLTMTAVVTWLYVDTRSSLLVSLFLVLRMGATVLGGFLVTSLLDRIPRFRTLWFVEIFRGALTLMSIPLAVLGQHYWVMSAVALSAALSSATDPSASSLVPELLPERLVHVGNAVHGVARNVVMVAGSLAGGLAVAELGIAKTLALDVATFALAALLYQRFASVSPPVEDEAPVTRSEVLSALLRQRVILGLTLSFTVVTVAMAIVNASLPAFFDKRLGDVHAYGYGMGAIGAGLLCGEALSSCVRRDAVARRSVALAFLFCATSILVLSDTTIQATTYLLLFLLGAADGTTEVVYDTLFQARLARNMLGGAFAASAAIQRVGMILGFLVAPLLLGFGSTTALVLAAAICAIGAVLAAAALVRARGGTTGQYLEPEPALATRTA
jgi:predicted MFS family arabinose efflux permease